MSIKVSYTVPASQVAGAQAAGGAAGAQATGNLNGLPVKGLPAAPLAHQGSAATGQHARLGQVLNHATDFRHGITQHGFVKPAAHAPAHHAAHPPKHTPAVLPHTPKPVAHHPPKPATHGPAAHPPSHSPPKGSLLNDVVRIPVGHHPKPAVHHPKPAVHPPKPAVHHPPKPAVHHPPKPVVHHPPKPAVHHPPKPAVHHPPKPAVHHPPKPAVHHPPKPAVHHPPKPAHPAPAAHHPKPAVQHPPKPAHPAPAAHHPKPAVHHPKPAAHPPAPAAHHPKPAVHHPKPAAHHPAPAAHPPKPAATHPPAHTPATHHPKPAAHPPAHTAPTHGTPAPTGGVKPPPQADPTADLAKAALEVIGKLVQDIVSKIATAVKDLLGGLEGTPGQTKPPADACKCASANGYNGAGDANGAQQNAGANLDALAKIAEGFASLLGALKQETGGGAKLDKATKPLNDALAVCQPPAQPAATATQAAAPQAPAAPAKPPEPQTYGAVPQNAAQRLAQNCADTQAAMKARMTGDPTMMNMMCSPTGGNPMMKMERDLCAQAMATNPALKYDCNTKMMYMTMKDGTKQDVCSMADMMKQPMMAQSQPMMQTYMTDKMKEVMPTYTPPPPPAPTPAAGSY
jgi:hypothetical protein